MGAGHWCETAVIGFYSILKLPFATRWHALISVPFFMVYFGVFLYFTGFMAIDFYVVLDEPVGRQWEAFSPIAIQFMIFVPSVLVSHGVSFVTNFIGKKEYLLTDDDTELMLAPYLRMGVMVGSIIPGAIIMAATGAPEALMAAFITFKIVLDVVAHLREHTRVGIFAADG